MTTFLLEAPRRWEDAERVLRERFPLVKGRVRRGAVTFYDTFDARIRKDGGSLSFDGAEWTWRGKDGSIRHRLRCGTPPDLAANVPPGSFRDALEKVVEMRRLLPLVEVREEHREIRVLDDLQKTVARLVVSQGTAREPDGSRSAALPTRLSVRALRGYEREGERIERRLAAAGLAPDPRDPLEAALQALGRTPVPYSSKLEIRLEPGMPLAKAVRAILGRLRDTLLANEDGVRREIDTEFLHDFRVAVRRARSLLGQVRGALPPEAQESFRAELAWLGKSTNAARDLDVWRLRLQAWRRELPEAADRSLSPLASLLASRRREIQHALLEALDSERYRRLLAEWRRLAEGPGEGPEGPRPVLPAARERIRKVYRKVRREGGAITGASPPEALHRLRIRCKKLRYLLEFFRSLFPEEEIGPLVRVFKRLQDCLGDFHDAVVQKGSLEQFARELGGGEKPPVETLLAMGRLSERLDRAAARERRRFRERFREFDGPENRARFRRILGEGKRDRENPAEEDPGGRPR